MDLIFVYLCLGVATFGLCWVVSVIFLKSKLSKDDAEKDPRKDKGNKKPKNTVEKPTTKGKGKQIRPRSTSLSDSNECHPWHAAVFKGHRDMVTALDWSSNGKFLASCAQDRTILIWFAKDLLSKDHRSIRVNVPFDSANKLCWSPDSTAFIVSRDEEKVVEVYKLGKKADGSLITVNSLLKFKNVHDESIVGIGIACTGNFIMSCSRDGNLVIWDLKGTVLERVSIPGGKVNAAKVSPCGRYVAACGLDCLIYEVKFSSTKEFQLVRIYGTLKGHESAVCEIDFNPDSSKIVTVTKTGTWRVFDTTGNRVNVVCLGKVTQHDNDLSVEGDMLPTVAISPDGRIVAVGHNNQVDIFEVQISIPVKASWNIPCGNVKTLLFSTDGKYLLTGGDRIIHAFHNVCGYQVQMSDLKKQIQDSSTHSALKNRLTKELERVIQDFKNLNLTEGYQGLRNDLENLNIS